MRSMSRRRNARIASISPRRSALTVVEAAWALHETVNGNMAQAAAIHALEKARRIEGYTWCRSAARGPCMRRRSAASSASRAGRAAGAGVASAFGFLAAPISFAFVRGWVAPLAALDMAALRGTIAGMEAEGLAMLAEAGVTAADATRRVIGALRYVGQGFQVEAAIDAAAIASGDRDAMRAAFEAEYLRQYGRTEPGLPVECVSWQVVVSGPVPALRLDAGAAEAAPPSSRPAWFPEAGGFVDTPVIDRAALRMGDTVEGPALVEERESTLVLPPGTRARRDAAGNLVVSLM
jgi:N-methylhydantoinase A